MTATYIPIFTMLGILVSACCFFAWFVVRQREDHMKEKADLMDRLMSRDYGEYAANRSASATNSKPLPMTDDYLKEIADERGMHLSKTVTPQ